MGVAALASSAATQASELSQAGFELTLARAVELQEAGGSEAALLMYRSLLEDRPHDTRLLYELARTSASLEDWEACTKYAEASTAIRSTYEAAALRVLAECRSQSGRSDEALAILEGATAAHPSSARLRFDFAIGLAASGRTEAAHAQLTQALDLASRDPLLLREYASVLEEQGRVADAVLMNLRYVMTAPHSPQATAAAESILALTDRTDAADASTFGKAFTAAREEAQGFEAGETGADRLNQLLLRFILQVVGNADADLLSDPLWRGAIQPLIGMAEHKVLGTYLYFVAALARTEGGPEWLKAHRSQFDQLILYLARPANPT